ncbi:MULTISPECIES: hypothetical protein [Streptomyces]|jgi:hypothetical protein|uniref:hypothetical protein n=1 Tax=Streptomyces TaxID=1883 RepID=UPI000F74853E|nr:hypothetical protein [Streptomyces sp. WAC05292]RSS83363.1 hypothetical protein EF903_25845 [Streptomyces sp. WAC05292]
MRRRHHFHIDHAGHSVSATVETGHRVDVELLVDGKETGHGTTRGDRPVAVRVELPTEPATPVTVRVTPGPGVPRCVLVAPGADPVVMSPRPY